MTKKQDIGINQRIPIGLLELAVTAAMQGNATPDYYAKLAASEYKGQNRIGKAVSVMNRLTLRNPLLPFLKENEAAVMRLMQSRNDRPLLFTALICAAYGFGYDVVALLGKFFHVQEQISTKLIVSKMSAKYGANRSLPNGLYCILPMLIDAGILRRPIPGVYEAQRVGKVSDLAMTIYKKSFIVHNEHFKENDDIGSHSYFEFINH